MWAEIRVLLAAWRRSFAVNKRKKMRRIALFGFGKCTLGIFRYWLGFSWRKNVGPMKLVCDMGFLKFVRWS